VKIFLLAAAAVLALAALTRLLEERLTYFPVRELFADPAAFDLRFDEVSVAADDGVRLRGWYCFPRAGRSTAPTWSSSTATPATSATACRRSGRSPASASASSSWTTAGSGAARGGRRKRACSGMRRRSSPRRGRGPTLRRPLGIYGESIGSLFAVRQAAANGAAAFLVLEGSFPGKRAVVARLPPYWPFLPFLAARWRWVRCRRGSAARRS